MRFRDLKKFNIACLTKQGWRLISNPFFMGKNHERPLVSPYFFQTSLVKEKIPLGFREVF